MIVKDEAQTITRAFESLKDIIDSYYISDTGSTDGTPEIITEWMDKNGYKGEVGFAEWKNFGYNRSLLFSEARNHKMDEISKAEYYIWLDADEVFITDKNDPLSYPSKEDGIKLYEELNKYEGSILVNILTVFGGVSYQRKNICRNDQLYKWEQPVHEYIVGTESFNVVDVNWIYDLARKEGNSSRNPDRYKKDANMFLDFLKENPGEPRALFYLGQTYEVMGDKEKAFECYLQRSDIICGYYEERYIACLRGGRISTDEEERKKLYKKGIEVNPQRLECYYELMMNEYRLKNYDKGVMYGMMAPHSREIKDHFMFAEEYIYHYSFDLHLGVCCYYSDRFDIGYYFTKRALNSVIKLGVGKDNYNRVLLESNLSFFENKIDNTIFCTS